MDRLCRWHSVKEVDPAAVRDREHSGGSGFLDLFQPGKYSGEVFATAFTLRDRIICVEGQKRLERLPIPGRTLIGREAGKNA